MSREITASPEPKAMVDRDRERERDISPQHGRRDTSPRIHKKSYSRSPSKPRKIAYRDGDRERDRRGDREKERRYKTRSRTPRDVSPRRSGSTAAAGGGGGGGYMRERARYSRSRSHSYGRGHSSSHSPMSSRRRHTSTRDNPKPNRCVGVFGLSVYTTEEELYHIFNKYGPVDRVQVVLDAKTGRSRGFSFVYFESPDDAKTAKDNCSGMRINGKNIRVDFSITERAHTPTPGIYMGRPTYESYGRDRDRERDRERDSDRGRERDREHRDRDRDRESRRCSRRSPSPYYRRERRRYDRSRSRSYSPRFKKEGYG